LGRTYVTKLGRQLAEVRQNQENTVRTTVQGETIHRKYKRFKLGGVQAYDRSDNWTIVIT